MDNIIFSVVILLSICAGLYAILITYKLYKEYRESYLSTYLYFQIFMVVFGIYGILGQVIAKEFLLRQESSFQTVANIEHFFTFLGIPFLIFSWYMFIRLCREIGQRRLSRAFNLSYFFVLTFIILAYGCIIVLMNVSDFEAEKYALLSAVIKFLYAGLEIMVLMIGLSQLVIHARRAKDEDKQKAVQIFAYMNLLVFCFSLLFFLHARQSRALTAIYLLVFFSRNIPPLLYWRNYLRRHFVVPAPQETDDQALRQFFDEFKISKREEEVIKQLGEGKTNKEISKALFISLQTVKDHIYRIYQKTDVKNRVQLVNLIQSYKDEKEL
jgi:DNA-binding CsgD family transcriptional regulator